MSPAPHRHSRVATRWIAATVGALVTVATAATFQSRTYTEADGLPNSQVNDVAQGVDGRLWLATRSGVTTYDGERWQAHVPPDGPPRRRAMSVGTDRNGDVWVLYDTPTPSVHRYDGENWSQLPFPLSGQRARATDLVVLDGLVDAHVAVSTTAGVHLWDGFAWRSLGRDDGLPHPDVKALALAEGRLWLGTVEGLAELNGEGAVDRSRWLEGVDDREILGLALTRDGDGLWIVARTWLGRLSPLDADATLHTVVGLEMPLPEQAFGNGGAAVAEDVHGGVYFGNAFELYYHHPEEGLSKLGPPQLPHHGATGLLVDREHNVWITGLRGVTKLSSRRFLTLDWRDGLLESEVSALLRLRDGRTVIGHPGGLTLDDGTRREAIELATSRRRHGLPFRVMELAEGHDGAVWIAAHRGGLGRLDPGGRIDWLVLPAPRPADISSVRVTSDGRVLALSGLGGLFEVVDGRLEPRLGLPRLPSRYTRRLFELSTGELVVGTRSAGLARIVDGTVVGWVRGPTAESNDVYALLEDDDGTLWVGTGGGLMRVRGDRLESVLPERPVYLLLRDARGRLWCGTDNGVVIWDGTRAERLSVEQGLSGRDVNRAAGLLDGAGRLWIGTGSGLSIYRDDWTRPPPPPPLVHPPGLLVHGEDRRWDDSLELDPHENDVTFVLRALSLSDEQRITFQSRLEGLDADWRETEGGVRQPLRFPRLPPGRYRLHARARGVDSAWSESVATPWVTVRKRFWERPEFFALAFFAAVALPFALYRVVSGRRHARRLEREVERRVAQVRRAEQELTRARRLESLAVFAGGLAHDFNNILTVILGNVSLMRSRLRRSATDVDLGPLQRAERAIGRATALTAQFRTFARGGAPVLEVEDVARIARESATLVLAGTPVRLIDETPAGGWSCEVDSGQMSQVFHNILLNAIEAMPSGGTVRLRGEVESSPPASLPSGRYVRVSIADDGSGIPDELRDRVFDPFFSTKEPGRGLGLASVYSIVRRHGGTLEIDSECDRGTTFHLWLPLADEDAAGRDPRPVAVAELSGRVLVMDDDPAVVDYVRPLLEERGCRVECRPDGEAAVEAYLEARRVGLPFDLVILDLTVRGGLGGRETLARLLQSEPTVRAIVMSGYSDDEVLSECRRFGFRAAIAKPFRPDDLIATVASVLAGSPSGGEGRLAATDDVERRSEPATHRDPSDAA